MPTGIISSTLFIVCVWLIIGVSVFGALDSYGLVPRLCFTVAWLLILRFALLLPQRAERNQTLTGRPKAAGLTGLRALALIVIVLGWALMTMVAISNWEFRSRARLLTWFASMFVLVVVIYCLERVWLERKVH